MGNEPQKAEVINRLFARLQGIYGNGFTGKFSTGYNASSQKDDGWENAKIVWADDLGGFDLEAIAYGLRNVDPDRAPSSRQFVELCRKAPRKTAQQSLPYRPTEADKQRIKTVVSQAAKAVSIDEYDPLVWAKKPKSQKAMDMLIDGAKRSMAMTKIFAEHIENGVCTEAGKLLKIYEGGGKWASV